jgi:transcriptional regulator with XRE-family HTH domain
LPEFTIAKSASSKKIVDPPEYNLGERLRYLRETRSLTQKQLALLASVSQATIAHVEKSTKDPSVETLRKIAAALDIHIATLFSTNDVYIFDMKRLRRKYNSADKLTPHLYMAIGRVVQYAKDIDFL